LEYVIYADESEENGPYFSNFYGGLLVRSPDFPAVLERLKTTKAELHLHGRVKWQKMTPQYLDKYVALMGTFLDLVEHDLVKVRIMFQHRTRVAVGLTDEQKSNTYYLLYYQFLKHAFGLQHAADPRGMPVSVRLYLDQRSGTNERKAQFKSYIAALGSQPQFKAARISFPLDQIAEVAISDHDLLQCLDVVLGAMQFRLNDWHKRVPEGKTRRAGRTIAKEKLYKAILARVRSMHPGFNIGISTGTKGDLANRWRDRYRHWNFTPSESRHDPTRVKPK
jgi:hypothetical protein